MERWGNAAKEEGRLGDLRRRPLGCNKLSKLRTVLRRHFCSESFSGVTRLRLWLLLKLRFYLRPCTCLSKPAGHGRGT